MAKGKSVLATVPLIFFLGSCGGGGGGSSSGNESTGVTPPSNAQPYFFSSSSSSSTSFSVVENNASAATIEVDDADSGDSLSLSIEGGDDAAAFQFDTCNASRCTSNTLLFKEAPDFERPNDVSEDNVYEVTLGVYDGTAKVTQEISITVTNAVEGRVVDAPISGASLCLDQDEDWECDVLPEDQACPTVWPPYDDCFTEPSDTSDAAGYYSIGEAQKFPDMQRRVLSIGGTDILTNKELPSLALIAAVNSDSSEAVAVTPLSTVISLASDPGATLVALGFPETVTPNQITSIDPWAIATGSSEASGDFASSAVLAENIGIAITELESIADQVITTSVQIANLFETANALVIDTTSVSLQTTTERAAIISKTVAVELVEVIDVAIASVGSADLGETAVINEVLKETTKEFASLIVAEIEAKQTNGTLDLSDANDANVAVILQIKETQEVIIQTGLDNGEAAKIAAISGAVADTNAFVESQVATSGIAVLTTASSAGELAEIITNTSTLVGQLVAGEITTEDFVASADINTQASSDDGFNDSVAQFTDSDGDGVFDADDAFPNDGSETVDSDGDGVFDADDVFPNDASESEDSDGDGVGDNADPYPSMASTANPNASTARLILEGFNQPQTNPEQWQIFSTNTSSYYIDRAKKVQRLLNQSFGGYMNYNLLVYEEEGPDEANQPVFDRLVALGHRGKAGWTTEEMEISCLDGTSAGNKQAGDWVFHSICLWSNSQWFNAPSNPPADFSKPAGVHEYDITGAMANEYFHHYQRVHGLDRGMDYQSNWGGDPYVTVNAPWWWVQGTAMITQTWWQRGILDELQYLSDEDRAGFKDSIDGRMEMHNSRYWMGLQMMQSSEPWINLQGENDEQRFGSSNCSDWLLAKKHYAYPDDMEGGEDCIAYDEMHIVPVHFMAYKSSWETVLKKIPESYYEYGFWGAVEIHLGLTEQEFYDEFNTFMRAQDWETIEVFYAPEGWNIPDGRIEEHVNFLDIDRYRGGGSSSGNESLGVTPSSATSDSSVPSVRASILYDPPPKDDRAKYLIQIGKNRPKTSMTNTYVKASDVPQSTQDSIETILQAVGEMLGYYDVNYFLYGGTYEGSEHVALAYCDLFKDKYDIKENRGCSRFTDKLRENLGTFNANSASPGFGYDAEYWANESVWINPPNAIEHYVEYYDATDPFHTRAVIHEYVSIHQSRPQLNATYFDEITGRPIPDWFMQGMQEFFALSANREINPFNDHQGNLSIVLEKVRDNKYGLQDITTRLEVWARQRDAGDYRDTDLGILAVAHMVSLTDWQTTMITLINEIYEKGWEQAFEDNIGMSMTDFYSEFEDHMAQDDATIIASVPASTDLKSELTPTSPIPRIQITGANNELNSGGEASDQKSTIYFYAADSDARHSYSGIDWPYVKTSGSSIEIDSDVTANFAIDSSGRILIDGMPLYQYRMDTTESQAKGDYNNDVWYSVLPNGSSSENLSFRPRLKD